MNDEIKARLKRIEGQVRGIHRMVEEGRPCEDVLTQILAARTALESVASTLVADHVGECLESMPRERALKSVERAVRLLGRAV